MKKLVTRFIFALSLAIVGGVVLYSAPKAHAATNSYGVTVIVSSTCVSSVNASYYDVAPGNSVSLTVTNNDNEVSQNVYVNGTNVGTVAPNSRTTNNQLTVQVPAVNSQTTVKFTPVTTTNTNPGVYADNCPLMGTAGYNPPTSSSFLINPASSTLTCTLSGSAWVLAGTFSGSSTGTGLYGSNGQVGSSISGAFSDRTTAQTSAETFSVVDGTSYGGKGTTLVSASCPAYSTAATTKVTPTTTATPAATATTTPGQSNTAVTSEPTVSDETSAFALKPSTTKLKSSNTAVIASSAVGAVIVILAIVGALILNGVVKGPKFLAKYTKH